MWIAVSGASLFAVMLLAVFIKLQTSQGKLIVEVDDPSATVQVLNEKNEVQVERKGEKGPVTIGLAPGKGRLRLVKDGVQLFAQDFSLVSGGEETIKARLEKPDETSSEPWSPGVALLDAKNAKAHQDTCARQLGVPVEITNAIGMKLALVPSGEFMMGSTKEMIQAELRLHGSDNWWSSRLLGETPQHRVRITKPFRLSVTEVTQEEFHRLMGTNPSKFQGDAQRPVEQATWEEAMEFCRKLSELPGERAAGRRYALPTQGSGNMRAGQVVRCPFSRRRILLSGWRKKRPWASTVGLVRTRTSRRIRWDRSGATPLASTTCMATSRNGAQIGTSPITMRIHRQTIRWDLQRARTAWFGAGASTTPPTALVSRLVSTTCRGLGDSPSASGSRRNDRDSSENCGDYHVLEDDDRPRISQIRLKQCMTWTSIVVVTILANLQVLLRYQERCCRNTMKSIHNRFSSPLLEAAMTSRPLVLFAALVVATGSVLCFASLARAQVNYQWDPDRTSIGSDDSGNWNSGNTWAYGGSCVAWQDGNNAVIGYGTGAAGTITIVGVVTPNSITFNPAGSGTYVITGGSINLPNANTLITLNTDTTISSQLVGNGGLAMAGSGALLLSTTETYTGLTTVSGGTLQLGNGVTGYDGLIAGNIVNNAALVYNLSGNQTYSGVINGTAAWRRRAPAR